MMTKFRLATPVQMVVMTVVWLGVLVAIDYAKNPRLRAEDMAAARPAAAGLSVWINHLCCVSCFSEVRAALATIPWIDPQNIRSRSNLERTEAQAAGAASDDGGWVDVGMTEVKSVDFVEIDRVLREKGVLASRIEFGGPQHFRMEARVRCCGKCQEALDRMMTLDRTRATARLRWVDSMTVDHAGQRLTVHARYQDSGAVIDVADLLGALDEAGLPAFSLHVLAGEEGGEVPAPEAGHDHSGQEPSPHGPPGHTH